MKKKFLAAVLAVCCMISSMSLGALAADDTDLILAYDFRNLPVGTETVASTGTNTGEATVVGGEITDEGVAINNDSYINLPENTFAGVGTNATISFWLNETETGNFRTLFQAGSDKTSYFILTTHDNVPRWAVKQGAENDADSWFEAVGYPLGTNEWKLLTYVQEGSRATIYINGEEVATNSSLPNQWSDYTDLAEFHIGGSTIWPDLSFTGIIGEFKIYNRALTETQVLNAYNELIGEPPVPDTDPDEGDDTNDALYVTDVNTPEFVNAAGSKGFYNAQTKEYSDVDNGGDPVFYYNSENINNTPELNWNINYTGLDQNKSYLLTAKMSFDFSSVDANADPNALVTGLAPCVYDGNTEVGWDNEGTWSKGVFEWYINGGLYTYGELKAMQEEADANGDGYVTLSVVINGENFKYNPADFENPLRIQARLAGLKNVNGGLKEQFGDTSIEYVAPDGIFAAFKCFELYELSSVAQLDKVTVNNVNAVINEAAKTVSVTLPAGSNAAAASVVATAKDGGTAVVSSDRKTITVTAEDGTVAVYALNISVAAAPAPSNPTNGIKDGILYVNGKAVTGSRVQKVGSTTYAVVNGKVAVGSKTRVVTVGSYKYIVTKNGTVTMPKKRTVKTVSGKSYVVGTNGRIMLSKKQNKLYKVGTKSYVVKKRTGEIIKSKKGNMLAKIGNKWYVVKKRTGAVIKGKKAMTAKVGKKTYVLKKRTGLVMRSTKKALKATVKGKRYTIAKRTGVAKLAK